MGVIISPNKEEERIWSHSILVDVTILFGVISYSTVKISYFYSRNSICILVDSFPTYSHNPRISIKHF